MGHIHSESEYDYTVSGMLVHKNKVLLIKHKYLPIWTPPAGHVELSETPIEALYKEIKEEAGIEAVHLTLLQPYTGVDEIDRVSELRHPLPFDMGVHAIGDDGHRHINMVYMFICDTDVVAPEVGESQIYQWFTHDELEAFQEIPPAIRQCAQFAISYVRENK